MVDLFPTDEAKTHALSIMQSLDSTSCIDYEGACSISTESLFSPTGGRLFGVLVCKDSSGRTVILKAFSGNIQGHFTIPGWVNPVCESTENQLYDSYQFYCADGTVKGLKDIFKQEYPPVDTADCYAVKLLHSSYKQRLLPISMAAWFYGTSINPQAFIHKQWASIPNLGCKPILNAMLGLDILYRDDDIVVVNKPSGLLSVPGRGEDKQDCVVMRLKRIFPLCIEQPSVHRLDMDTSGLLVLAFTQQAHRHLSIQFIKRQVTKSYIALIDGVVAESGGTIELAFRYDPEHKPRQKYDPVLGKWGTTVWERIREEHYNQRDHLVTRVRFTPKTGRTHQLRLHSMHPKGLGSPIVGDPLYGTVQSGERLMLHASELSFTHPASGERMYFSVDADF